MTDFVVGRDKSQADIVVPSTFVSRSHLLVKTLGNGRYLVEDLGSTGGTFLFKDGAWTKITKAALQASDRIRLANYEATLGDLMKQANPQGYTADGLNKPGLGTPSSSGRSGEWDVFLSYAREDQDRVRPIVDLLSRQGWRVFWDRTIKPGEQWADVINDAMQTSKAVVVVWSRASTRSQWVKAEAMAGRESGMLVPVRIDETHIPLPFSLLQTADFSEVGSSKDFNRVSGALIDSIGVLIRARKDNPSQAIPVVRPSNLVQDYNWRHIFFALGGRINRKQFWVSQVILIPISIMSNLVIEALVHIKMPEASAANRTMEASLIGYTIFAYIYSAIFIKRFHDFGWSAWWTLPVMIFSFLTTVMSGTLTPGNTSAAVATLCFSVLFLICWLYLGFRRGSPWTNQHGVSPSSG